MLISNGGVQRLTHKGPQHPILHPFDAVQVKSLISSWAKVWWTGTSSRKPMRLLENSDEFITVKTRYSKPLKSQYGVWGLWNGLCEVVVKESGRVGKKNMNSKYFEESRKWACSYTHGFVRSSHHCGILEAHSWLRVPGTPQMDTRSHSALLHMIYVLLLSICQWFNPQCAYLSCVGV